MSTVLKAFTSHDRFIDRATFRSLAEQDCSQVPPGPGVYVVLAPTGDPDFAETSCGGHFKRRDPTVPVEILEEKWVDGAPVIYIGKADDLHRRVREFTRFGQGRPIGHWGGRYIWQVDGCQNLVVAWLPTPDEKPRAVEERLLDEFVEVSGRLPFANLKR